MANVIIYDNKNTQGGVYAPTGETYIGDLRLAKALFYAHPTNAPNKMLTVPTEVVIKGDTTSISRNNQSINKSAATSLLDAQQMFQGQTNITCIRCDMPHVLNLQYFADGCTNLEAFYGSLASFTGVGQSFSFTAGGKLKTFISDLSSLEDGSTLFVNSRNNCSAFLDEESVRTIAETIKDWKHNPGKTIKFGIFNTSKTDFDNGTNNNFKKYIDIMNAKGWNVVLYIGDQNNSSTSYTINHTVS